MDFTLTKIPFRSRRVRRQKSYVELWKKTFPDPSNSPARHTRDLSILGLPAVTAVDTDVGSWIRTFRNVVRLRLECTSQGVHQPSLVPFYGLSPAVRSLHLTATTAEAFDLTCSFPLLENLSVFIIPGSDAGRWNRPLTSSRLTGSLNLYYRTLDGIGVRSATRRLLDFPGGLHFAKIRVTCRHGDLASVTGLVSGCSGTLESFSICYFSRGVFPAAFATG